MEFFVGTIFEILRLTDKKHTWPRTVTFSTVLDKKRFSRRMFFSKKLPTKKSDENYTWTTGSGRIGGVLSDLVDKDGLNWVHLSDGGGGQSSGGNDSQHSRKSKF